MNTSILTSAWDAVILNFYPVFIQPTAAVFINLIDAVVPKKRVLLPNTSLEIMVPSRTSVVGFLIGWGCVAAIIYAVYLLACA